MVHVQVTPTAMELLPLLCLCVLTRSGTTFADQHGSSVITVAVEEGRDAVLPCSFSTKENIEKMVFDWKKDNHKEVFLYDAGHHYNKGRTGQDQQFNGRVFHFEDELKHGNASIKIHNTKMADNGSYSCNFPNKQLSHIILVVDPDPESFMLKDRRGEKPGAAPEPYVTIINQTKDWALLQCVVRGASPKPKVQWQDSDGNILHAEESKVTERGGRYDIILQTTVTKTDRYRCVATQEEIKHQIHAETYVHMNGAVSKPSIMILGETQDGVQLQCEVHGASPKPEVQWQDGAGNILPAKEPQVSERGGSYDIILQTTVTKTDHYRCVATQEEINHQIHAETYVPVHGFSTGHVVTAVAAVLGTLLLVGVVVAVLRAKGCIKCSKGGAQTRVPHEDPNHLV